MDYKILYPGAFPIIEMQLQKGESIKAEADAMVAMSSTVDVMGSVHGGIMQGIARMLAGEKFFFQTLTANRGPGTVLLAPSIPGDIIDIKLDGTYNLIVQKDGFLAGTQDLQVSTKMQNLMQGFFSGEGFFVVKVSGYGKVFVNSYGGIHAINLDAGEEFIIDNHHLVAWPDYMDYKIERASSSWIHTFTSGEIAVCRFRGPGTVLIQTRNPGGFGNWIKKFIPGGRPGA
ncbi:TIGR00266 family protein [Heliorestis convoluta]|uniref:TIGR00266 family protein, putative n=1 Tax=Heliorestis convoluta TaxID=356322 RepID=A0A5Q2MW39_9FIRM|nr:TIGR00266 family protein [Heliorestis convoluta]QGG46488.1 TIGR00266 family protein, putative [Heliorestis convoluta]